MSLSFYIFRVAILNSIFEVKIVVQSSPVHSSPVFADSRRNKFFLLPPYLFSLVYRNVSLIPLQETVPINCPGVILQYNCSVDSNSEDFVLTVVVTLPNRTSSSQTFENTLLLNMSINLLSSPTVIVTLRALSHSERHAEAIVELTVELDVPLNGTMIQCIFGSSNSSLIVITNDPLGKFLNRDSLIRVLVILATF